MFYPIETLKILRKGSKEKGFRKVADILRPCSPFSDSMLSSRSVFRVNNGFTSVNMIKTDTLCNENNYELEKQREQENV